MSSIAGTNCPAGTYSDVTNVISLATCKPCTGGYYCTGTGLITPTGACTEGYYCTKNAIVAAPPTLLAGSYGPCPVGYYCPTGSAAAVPCPPGTMNTLTLKISVSNCLPCTAGSYCATVGRSAIEGLCAIGYYCPAGQMSPTPALYYCAKG